MKRSRKIYQAFRPTRREVQLSLRFYQPHAENTLEVLKQIPDPKSPPNPPPKPEETRRR
jgi:hypothetical protein